MATSKKKTAKKKAKKKQPAPKKELFPGEYIKDFNITKAAIRCGYSEKTAAQQGSRLLKDVKVQEAIQELVGKINEKAEIDALWLLKRLVDESTADINDLYFEEGGLKPVHQWPLIWRQGLVGGLEIQQQYEYEDGEPVPAGVVTKVKLSDRAKRLEMIGRHIDIKAFITRNEHSGPGGGPIESVNLSKEEYAEARKKMLEEDDC